jgi:hypothetical protein
VDEVREAEVEVPVELHRTVELIEREIEAIQVRAYLIYYFSIYFMTEDPT